MRKYYLDNIRWMTVVIVVIYHVFYMYNAEGILGGLGKITSLSVQPASTARTGTHTPSRRSQLSAHPRRQRRPSERTPASLHGMP